MRRLPPLSAVRVFEAAARLENFTQAAAELGMTQAAVSHQIRSLETYLGLQLFRRHRRQVRLTDAARRVALSVGRSLDQIEAAFSELRAEDDSTLIISTTHTFANAWLAWRLGRFQVENPQMAVRLVVNDALSDLSAEGVDLAIRSGRGDWEGVNAELLMQQSFTPMCSPGFLAQQGGALTPGALLRLPLVSPDDPAWAQWFREAGVGDWAPPPRGGIRMDSEANEGHAAMAGQGVALLTPFFWRVDLAEGRLVRPFSQTTTQGQGYWAVTPEHRRASTKIRRFKAWLKDEVQRSLQD